MKLVFLRVFLIVSGKDLIGLAQTGSGKTAAFAIPIIQALLDAPRSVFFALVLSPTRLVMLLFGFIDCYYVWKFVSFLYVCGRLVGCCDAENSQYKLVISLKL